MGAFKDLTGMKFHHLTVIEQAGRDKYDKILWRCICDCGKETVTHGRDLVEVISEEAYQRGLNDAWEAAKKIVSIPTAELHTMLDKAVYYDTVFRDCTASECIEKIRAYEEKKKAEQEIKVGDWVQNGGVIGVVTYIEQTKFGICYHVLGEDGYLWRLDDTVTKKYKGRVPKEIAGFLKKVEADR